MLDRGRQYSSKKGDAQKEALKNSSRKDKGDFIMKLATAEEKLFELLEKTANLSAKVALGRGLTDKAATDIAMYENFLNRSYLPTSISEDPDSVVAHLMENLRFGQSVYDSSVIISSGDFKDFGDLLESVGGIFV